MFVLFSTTRIFDSPTDLPVLSSAMRLVWPKPLPVRTIWLLFLIMVTSATDGLPMMIVTAFCGNCNMVALSSVTRIVSFAAFWALAAPATLTNRRVPTKHLDAQSTEGLEK
jgi:hypothetical protein